MSLSLDGRLPSGQRTELMRHIAACADCHTAWEGMKQAQDLALTLPAESVSTSFRDGLESRIRSGEGAAGAVYSEPVSAWAKVRYVATGAAAAALMIAALNVFAPERPAQTEVETAQSNAVTRQEPRDQGALRPRTVNQSRAPFADATNLQPVNEFSLARSYAENFSTSANRLRARLASLPADEPLQKSWHEVRDIAAQVKAGIGVMQWFDSKEIVGLPQDLRREFVEADRSLGIVLDEAPSWEDRRVALDKLGSLRLDRVRNRMDIRCCRSANDLWRDLGDLIQHMPEASKFFQFITLDETGTARPVAPGQMMMQVRVRIVPQGGEAFVFRAGK